MLENSLPKIPLKYDLTPEFRLLAACSWIAPPSLEHDQAQKILSLCKGGVDWEIFVSLVRRHGVPALVDAVLNRHARNWLSDKIHNTLKAHRLQVTGESLRQTAELIRISKLFAGRGIDLIVMRGVLLSQRLYSNPALRASTDIDLLVRLRDFDYADQLLRDAGYLCYSPGNLLTERQKKFHRSTGQNYEYTHNSSGLKLELHWRSYLWTQEQTEQLWDHCQPLIWQGERFNIWDDDILLLSLCYHGAHHEWCSFKWLSDVAMLFFQDRPGGWDRLLSLSGQLGMRRVLAQSALLVHWVYDLPLPGQLCTLVKEEHSSVSLGNVALRAMLMSSGELAAAGKRLDSLRHSRYLMKLIPSLPYSELLKSIVIRDADFKEFPLPNKLFWLYVPLRPVFWLLRNFRAQKNGTRCD